MIPVVVGTGPGRGAWLGDCLTSIRVTSSERREVLVHETGGYEPAAILTGCGAFDTFLFLHDSVVILSREFWTIVDQSGPAWLAGFPPMFLAVYNSAQVAPLLPTGPVTKQDVIRLEADLPAQLTMPTLWPELTDASARRHEYRHGRDNKVLGNRYFEKLKGTWS